MIAAYFLVIRKPDETSTAEEDDESALIEVQLEDRPVAILTPRSDGHWLDLEIGKLGRFEAGSMDYELLYKTEDGLTQGVPGTISLDGQENVERELLLGSESSGKFRYDEGVETGTFTLRFRNDKGRLVAKFTTDFHLQTDTDELSTVDGAFVFTLPGESDEYFVTMQTFGVPEGLSNSVAGEPYGIFSSYSTPVSGEVSGISGNLQVWNGKEWSELDGSDSDDIGIFVSAP